jgi:hypothetical protein
MATTKPRINVTLEPHRYAMFKRLAALQGVSMSSLIGELLEAVAEPMERVCVVLEAAAKAPGDLKAGLRSAVDRAEATLMPAALKAIDQFDMFMGDVGDVIEAAGGPAGGCVSGPLSGPPAADLDPRLVTRGSTPLRDTKTAAVQGTAKPKRRAPSKRKAA